MWRSSPRDGRDGRDVPGATGATGATGGTGPRGAQGIQGIRGDRGLAAAAPITKLTALILSILILIFFSVIQQLGERDSCIRQDARTGTAIVAATAYNARLDDAEAAERRGDEKLAASSRLRAEGYAKAWRESQPLNCSLPFPDTKPSADAPRHPPRVHP